MGFLFPSPFTARTDSIPAQVCTRVEPKLELALQLLACACAACHARSPCVGRESHAFCLLVCAGSKLNIHSAKGKGTYLLPRSGMADRAHTLYLGTGRVPVPFRTFYLFCAGTSIPLPLRTKSRCAELYRVPLRTRSRCAGLYRCRAFSRSRRNNESRRNILAHLDEYILIIG